jgi:CO/xanthine dehydrogenase FAD-binding subunit
MIKNIRPDTYEELLNYIDQEDLYVFAGGTDLMVRKRQWQGAERRFDKPIIYVSHLEALKGIQAFDDRYEIGACTTQNEVACSELLPDYIKGPISKMATPSIRNLATIGGNVVNDASVGDSIPLLFALDADLVLTSVKGQRIIKIEEFILGKYKTALAPNELLEKIIIPRSDYSGYFYRKTGLRKASILSKLSVYVLYRLKEGGLEDLRVSVGAINDIPIRSRVAERSFIEDGKVEKFIYHYKSMMEGQDDKRSTKAYREEIACRLIEKYLREVTL